MVKRLRVVACGLVVLAALLAGGCTPESGPAQSTSPSPVMSAPPSPTPSPTPTENAQERQQRLDFEAAKGAYLAATSEFDRLLMSGGAREPTRALLATTSGDYRRALMYVLETFKANRWHSDRPIPQIVAIRGGWSPNELDLAACEDTSKVRYLDRRGKEVLTDRKRRYVHSLTAKKTKGQWKIATIDSEAVKSFTHEACGK